MSLDSVSIALSLTISLFSFLIFSLYAKRREMNVVQSKLKPVAEEAKSILMQNFLAFGIIPSKSKLISVLSGVANKHNVQLLSHFPLHEIIDDIIFSVVSNELLESDKKEAFTNSLVKLKSEPMNSEDYVYLVSEIEKDDMVKQKAFYSTFMTALIASSIVTIATAIPFVQFKYYWSEEVAYIANLVILSSLGFSILTAMVAIWSISSTLFRNTARKTPEQRKALLNLSKTTIDNELASTVTASTTSLITKVDEIKKTASEAMATESKPSTTTAKKTTAKKVTTRKKKTTTK